MNARFKYVLLLTVTVFVTLLSTACATRQAEIDWEAVNAAQTATAQAGSPTLTIDQRVQATVHAMGGQPAGQPPASTPMPAAPENPASGTDYQGTDQCQDGKIVSNQFADISRIPIGTLEGAVVAEISWTGSGFGGFDRAVVVVPRMTSETMAFVRNSRTIHLVQYCGFLKDILAYAPTHVDAMVQSAQDDQGNRPDPEEIGVYFLNLDGVWTVIREGPKGPGLAFVQQRVVMTPH